MIASEATVCSTPSYDEDEFSGSPVQVISVAGGKGGVGKSSLALNLAIAMAQNQKRVLLMDANLGLANIDVMLNIKVEHNLSHVIRAEKNLEDIIVDGPSGIKIVPSASGVSKMTQLSSAENAGLVNAFGALSYDIDTLIIDTAAGITSSMLTFCEASREVMLVVCDEPTSIVDALATIRVLNTEHGVHRFRVVANKTESAQQGLDLYNKLVRMADTELDVLLDFNGSIPMDAHLQRSIQEQSAVVNAYPRSRASLAFKKLASKVGRWPMPEAPGGRLEFFVERLIKISNKSG